MDVLKLVRDAGRRWYLRCLSFSPPVLHHVGVEAVLLYPSWFQISQAHSSFHLESMSGVFCRVETLLGFLAAGLAVFRVFRLVSVKLGLSEPLPFSKGTGLLRGWTNLVWFRVLEVVALQRDLFGILLLTPRTQGLSWSLDLLIYLAGVGQLAVSWWELQEPPLAPALRLLFRLLQKVERLLGCTQIVLYLEHCLFWWALLSLSLLS